MRQDAFRAWLAAPRYVAESAASILCRVRRIEAAYGDLDACFDDDGLASLIEELSYTSLDRDLARPNTTRIAIDGDLSKGLASLKAAV